MDERTTRRIRERARILHWVSELVLAIVAVVAVLVDWGWRFTTGGEIFLDQQLSLISVQVYREFSRFYFGRADQLIAYPPPAGASEREAWARKIIADFDQPAAVFVRDERGLSWITRPREMAPGIERLERVLTVGAEKPDVVTRHVVGEMVTFRIGTLTDTTGTAVVMVGPNEDSLRWGVVIHYRDAFRAFLKSLNDPQTMVAQRHPAYTLQRLIVLPSDPSQDLPRLRAALDGEVLFESPKLDTTKHRYVFDHEGVREEYYATPLDEIRALLITRPFLSWKFFMAVALVMLVIHIYWLWIRKLTAPTL